MKLSIKFDQTKGDYKTRLHNKFAKCKLYGLTKNPEEWITKLELFRGYLQKLDMQTDNSEIMTHILSNLPE